MRESTFGDPNKVLRVSTRGSGKIFEMRKKQDREGSATTRSDTHTQREREREKRE